MGILKEKGLKERQKIDLKKMGITTSDAGATVRQSFSTKKDKIKSRSLVESDPIYIGSLNGRDEGDQIEDLSDDDT